MSRYMYYLSPDQFWIAPTLFIAGIVLIFWIVPMIPRSRESGEIPLLRTRAAFVLFTRKGRWPIIGGGNFYRVTLYRDCIFIAFISNEMIAYGDIDSINLKAGMVSEVQIIVGAAMIRIFGMRKSMTEFSALLKEHREGYVTSGYRRKAGSASSQRAD
jgi:hypothetical protein